MQIIKLDATESTNLYLKNLISNVHLDDYAAVISQFQTNGRGQFGTKWDSDAGKNLLISVLRKDIDFNIEEQFYINMRVTLAVYMTLKYFNIPKLSIKWPNDILSCDKKISGVLIEFIIKNKIIRHTIIGLGLNVNQIFFQNLPNATSMKLVLNKSTCLDKLRIKFLKKLKYYFSLKNNQDISIIYHKLLYKNGEICSFKTKGGYLLKGQINGVSYDGKLKILLNGSIKEFELKSIQMIN
ncbi:MAG: biotin--[acetyl-CoA-carboxylase] ligase [Flavobacteriaceae bacterium]